MYSLCVNMYMHMVFNQLSSLGGSVGRSRALVVVGSSPIQAGYNVYNSFVQALSTLTIVLLSTLTYMY